MISYIITELEGKTKILIIKLGLFHNKFHQLKIHQFKIYQFKIHQFKIHQLKLILLTKPVKLFLKL